MLCILDGVGLRDAKKFNAVKMAKMPFWETLQKYPHGELRASGTAVGLPPGVMGNSEVGHITIGAGRIVNQFLRRFALTDWKKNQALKKLISDAKKSSGVVHLIGMMSDGRVHSDISEIIFIGKKLTAAKLKICIHFISDGRDTPPRSAEKYIKKLQREFSSELKSGSVWFGSLMGRYFAMDRNQNMARTESAFNAIACGNGKFNAFDINSALRDAYARGESDEFISPTIITKTPIKKSDTILFCNYRADRARQLLRMLLKTGAKLFGFSNYGEGLDKKITPLLPDTTIKNTLGDVLESVGLRQLRIAETEKYNHITYFFDAEKTLDFSHGEKLLIPSPRVRAFDTKPEMSAKKITDTLLKRIGDFDMIILNFANGDMVGHTGNLPATIRAMEFLDSQLARIVPRILEIGGVAIITADHGNAEKMRDKNGKIPKTSHTKNRVPFIVAGLGKIKIRNGGLSDIAPTILKILGIKQPPQMTGRSLIS